MQLRRFLLLSIIFFSARGLINVAAAVTLFVMRMHFAYCVRIQVPMSSLVIASYKYIKRTRFMIERDLKGKQIEILKTNAVSV